MSFPQTRLRRLRRTPALRRLVRETRLAPSDFVLPLFACPGRGVRRPVGSMPGVHQTSVDQLVKDAREAARLGIGAVILFGIPAKKDPLGKDAYSKDGIVQQATRAVKSALPEMVVLTDLCFCEYTDHGHCGVLKRTSAGPTVDNDATLELIARAALTQAEAGADGVAPSGMMDGAVRTVRRALDQSGKADAFILAYAAKFASAFYGPFRDAARSAPGAGDRKSYQMDPANGHEALREAALDVEEGADVVMVKPALAYLDVVRRVKEELGVPVAAYNVSGEYSMVKAAAARGWADGGALMMEVLTSIKRAGAAVILTYHAREAAKRLRE
jgi:porphobilinogen synthase